LLAYCCCWRTAVAGVPASAGVPAVAGVNTVVNIPFTNGVPPILAFLLLLVAPDVQIFSIAAVGLSVIVIFTVVVSLWDPCCG
jgi:hypothetical protein